MLLCHSIRQDHRLLQPQHQLHRPLKRCLHQEELHWQQQLHFHLRQQLQHVLVHQLLYLMGMVRAKADLQSKTARVADPTALEQDWEGTDWVHPRRVASHTAPDSTCLQN